MKNLELVTETSDPINMGTYNYCGSTKNIILHGFYDVIPYDTPHLDWFHLFTSGFVGIGLSWGNVVEQYYTEYVGPPSQNKIKYSNNAIANNNYIYYQNIFK